MIILVIENTTVEQLTKLSESHLVCELLSQFKKMIMTSKIESITYHDIQLGKSRIMRRVLQTLLFASIRPRKTT